MIPSGRALQQEGVAKPCLILSDNVGKTHVISFGEIMSSEIERGEMGPGCGK